MGDAGQITQLNVRVPVGMVRVLDELAAQAHLSRAHYLAHLVKAAQVERDARHDGQVYRDHGQTKLGRRIAESGMDLLVEARAANRE